MIMSKKSKNIFIWLIFNRAGNNVLNTFQTSFQRWIFHVFDFRFFSKLLINKLNISKTFSKHCQIIFQNFSSNLHLFYHDWSDLNDKTDFVFSRISRSIMGLPYGVSPNPLCTYLVLLVHIQNIFVNIQT